MNLSKLLTFVLAFCFSILIAIQTKGPYPKTEKENTSSEPAADGPEEFIKFHKDIRTPEDATSPQYKNGFLISELRAAQLTAQAARKNGRTQANGVLEWKERGPSNVPGRTRGLLVDPADPTRNTWLAGSASGGVWKTTNAGNSWVLVTPDLSNLATTVLAMAASNPNTIYLGTGEGFGNIDGVQGNGMYKSTDRGQTWSYLPTTSNFDDINRAIVDPNNENIVVVATNSGIYKTTNGGNNWTKVSTLTFIQDLKATPGNFSIQYSTRNGVGVLKSINAGDTWTLSNVGMGQMLRCEIDISPVKTNRIFASCENGDSPKMLMSDNAGVSWSIINLTLNNVPLDFLGGTQLDDGQGWYDNTIACDPFDRDVVYFGGINLFRAKLESAASTGGFYIVEDVGFSNFMTLTNFSGASNGSFDVGSSSNNISVEVRFGPSRSQKAHRFLVPTGSSSGVAAVNYSYQDYINVPFEVWDITNNRQLMASFRDQGRDGAFDLIPGNVDSPDATLQAREYLFINNVAYNASSPSADISKNGGHEFSMMFNIWPFLTQGATWPPTTNGILRFTRLSTTTTFITDGRGQYGNPNKNSIVHVDHHNIVMIPMTANTYKILNANDGGVYVSNVSSTPGLNDGEWSFAGNSYNTSQFYGADKRPGAEEYFGGMQDNGTWKSPSGILANKTTSYSFNIGGDGFEVIWNNFDGRKLIGGSQGNNFRRSLDGGSTWAVATSGLSGTHPFISKLANSRDNPDVLFTLSSAGVFRSPDFGQSWILTPIADKWGGSSSLMDIEVSRANANIVWAGNGMANSGTLRNLHVSINGGISFAPTNNYTTTALGSITKLASHPTQQSTAYALFSFAGRPKVLRTTNLGQSWTDISGFSSGSSSSNGFPDVAVYCLYVRTDDPDIIWVGTEIGIVESLNNGQSWALINDFPKVSVWDIKAQDDQLVIASHGRGIWTAQLSAVQKSSFEKPIVEAVGTSPKSDLVVRYKLLTATDSVQVFINNQKIGKIGQQTSGGYIVNIKGVAPGNVDVKIVGFKDKAPFPSLTFAGKQLNLISPFQKQYANLFKTISDFSVENFLLSNFGSSNQSLQTAHNYFPNQEATAILLQPIVVDNTNSNFFYQDVALVQPSATGVTFGQPAFKDFVVVEATKDGLNWIPLKDGYNASANAQWLAAYNVNQTGVPSLSVDQTIDLKSKFKATDTLLFRFRLKADADATTGWGWSIDNLFIQQPPTGVELSEPISDLTVFPNPTGGKSKIQFTLIEDMKITIETLDAKGNSIGSQLSEKLPAGNHEQNIDLTEQATGLYYVRLKSNKKSTTVKLIKK
ncbi:MAG: T9SS type A sorting domain-containing protein [Cytophagales bacterium]|nr:T9SS type A sorting domain-containing protein [Cytophagales bacterium]